MRFIVCLLFSSTVFCSRAQDSPPVRDQDLREIRVDKDFQKKYDKALREIRRVYPLALQAKAYLIEFEKEYQEIERKRKKKQFGKQAHKILKDEFMYDIRDLYISQGIMLMKLVHRETGQTVSEIVTKYRGQLQGNLYEGMGKIWDQDLGVEYDPFGKDWIIELVLQDIIDKKIPFNWELKPLNKEEFKENQKEYKKRKKEYRKSQRKYKKVQRHTKRAASST